MTFIKRLVKLKLKTSHHYQNIKNITIYYKYLTTKIVHIFISTSIISFILIIFQEKNSRSDFITERVYFIQKHSINYFN